MRLIDADAIPYREYLGDDEPRVYKSQIDAMPAITTPSWIPVTERFPECDGRVLCRYGFEKDGKRSDMVFTGCLDYYAFDPEPHFQHASTGLFVTHWMPLPEPPGKGGDTHE